MHRRNCCRALTMIPMTRPWCTIPKAPLDSNRNNEYDFESLCRKKEAERERDKERDRTICVDSGVWASFLFACQQSSISCFFSRSPQTDRHWLVGIASLFALPFTALRFGAPFASDASDTDDAAAAATATDDDDGDLLMRRHRLYWWCRQCKQALTGNMENKRGPWILFFSLVTWWTLLWKQ